MNRNNVFSKDDGGGGVSDKHPAFLVDGQPVDPIHNPLQNKLKQEQNFWQDSQYVDVIDVSEEIAVSTNIGKKAISDRNYLG